MKKYIQNKTLFLTIFFFIIFTAIVFADEPNPAEPPEDVTETPISDNIWILCVLGLFLVFYKYKKGRSTIKYSTIKSLK